MKNIQATENKGLNWKLLSSIDCKHLLSAVALAEMPVENKEWQQCILANNISIPCKPFQLIVESSQPERKLILTEVLRSFLPLGYVFTPLQHVKQSP